MTQAKQIHAVVFYSLMVAALVASFMVTGISAPKQTAPTKAVPHSKLPKTTSNVPKGKEVATLAGGCFWSMEAIYQQLKGVEKVESGYAGGHKDKPKYEEVGTSTTGHAESLQIIFDPKVISYADILTVLLTMRDPTTRDRQGPDEGPQYRSAVFYHSEAQQKEAQEVFRKINAAKIWKSPIVTEITPFANFYRAEDYHLNYYALNPKLPYCSYVIAPKLSDLRKKFPNLVKPEIVASDKK